MGRSDGYMTSGHAGCPPGPRSARSCRALARPVRARRASLVVAAFAILLAVSASIALPGLASASSPAHPRVASINLCTDQLVLLLADDDQILSINHLSNSSEMSALRDKARRYPVNHGLAEEIVRANPDLVLAGLHTSRTAVGILRRLGYRVIEVDYARSFDAIADNVMKVAEALGQTARGARLVADMRARLARIEADVARRRDHDRDPRALYLRAFGQTTGGDTLMDTVMTAAGVINVAAEQGVVGYSIFDLERIIHAAPDMLIVASIDRDATDLSHRRLQHPALTRGLPDTAQVSIPSALVACGAPFTVDAVRMLADAASEHLADHHGEAGQ